MRAQVAIFAALCCMSAAAAAQVAKPQVVALHPGSEGSDAIVVPPGSHMQLASFPGEYGNEAKFRGNFTVSGAYELSGYGDESTVTIWPDDKSIKSLPYWRQRGGPEELYLSNPWAFAEAVVAKEKLAKLKAGKLEKVRGTVTIVADDYETSIECDVAGFSARFVSLVKAMQIAKIPQTEESC